MIDNRSDEAPIIAQSEDQGLPWDGSSENRPRLDSSDCPLVAGTGADSGVAGGGETPT